MQNNDEILGIVMLKSVEASKEFYEKIINEKDKKIEKLEKENRKLKEENERLNYVPGNHGYVLAMEDFNKISSTIAEIKTE